MAEIRKEVKLELTDEEKDILRKASKIIEEVAEEDGADMVFDVCETSDTNFWYISGFLVNMINISD